MQETTSSPSPTLYDEIGGERGVAAAVDLFYEKVWADPLLAPWFEGIDGERLKGHQRAFIGAALGGPDPYPGRTMQKAHADRAITGEAFDRVAVHLSNTLTELGVQDATAEQVMGAIAPLKPEIVSA